MLKSRLFINKVSIFVTVVLMVSSGVASAHSEIKDFYNGVRSLGMGGAYTAIVNDETALLTNPAGLSRLRDKIVTVVDPELSGSTTNTEMMPASHLTKAAVQSPYDLLQLLKEHPGKHWFAKAQFFPSFAAPNVGFGLHAKWKYDAEVNSESTNYRLDYTQDYAAVLGFSLKFFGGIVKIGGSARYVNRTEIHKDFDPNVATIDMNQTASEGTGLAVNAGLILTAPVQWLPTIAVTARDVGNTSYALTSGMFLQTQTRPADSPQVIDAGFSLNPILSNTTRMVITADYHDVTNAYQDEDAMKRIHAGVEFNFDDVFFLRGGYHQRYWTAGFELASRFIQFQAATYGEEIGTSTAPREDRRWVGKFSVRF